MNGNGKNRNDYFGNLCGPGKEFKSKEDLIRQFEEDFRTIYRDQKAIDLMFSKYEAWTIMATIQLASRHPEFQKTITYREAIECGKYIEKEICKTPALKAVAKLGWDRNFDMEW